MGETLTFAVVMFLNGIYAGVIVTEWLAARRPKPASEKFWGELRAMLRKSAAMNRFAGNCVVNRFECEISDLGRFQFTVETLELHRAEATASSFNSSGSGK